MPTSEISHSSKYLLFFCKSILRVKLFSKTIVMQTNCPNVLFNHQTILLFEKTSQIMKQKLLLMLMLVSFCSSLFAQGTRNTSETIVVRDMNSILSSNRTSVSARVVSANTGTVDVQRLRNLITQVQPSEYFYAGELKSYGDAPSNLFTDLASLNRISSSNINKRNIEIVTIRINTASELDSAIDLAAFSDFTNLKYIYFIAYTNTTSENIANHIVNYNSRFNIFYKVDKGDSNQ